jgi:two-component system cell cycle response regulator
MQNMRKTEIEYHSKIFVVDSDTTNLQFIIEILATQNYMIETASDGQQALNHIKKSTPDLIILDAALPVHDGFEITRWLKNNPAIKNIPIIIITDINFRSEEKALEAGADEFLNKPFNSAELLARISSMLKLKMYQDQFKIRKEIEFDFADHGISKREVLVDNNNLELNHILLVEDNLMDIKLVKTILYDKQFSFTIAENGEDAIRLALNNQFDLIILDYLLPDMNGLDIFQRLKRIDVYQHVPVVFVTSLSDNELKIKCLELDADDFFVKPINGKEFRAKMQLLLKKKMHVDKLRFFYQNAIDSAIKDGLTGLYKRSYFLKRLDQEIKKILRNQDCLSVMMIDIDNFKVYNDHLGHLGGDNILLEVSKRIVNNIREFDLAARYGGEEFIVLLTNTEKANALIVAQRIKSALLEFPLPSILLKRIDKLTVSIGIADFPHSSHSSSDLIHKADLMLYQAKKTGKNKACVFI